MLSLSGPDGMYDHSYIVGYDGAIDIFSKSTDFIDYHKVESLGQGQPSLDKSQEY